MNSFAARFALWSLILLVAVGARLGAGAWWQSRMPDERRFTFPDSEGYWELGQTIAKGEPYQFGADDARIFRMPGYPLLLAVMFRAVGTDVSPMCGCALSALLGGAAVAAAMWWARQLFDGGAALVAGLVVALYPGAVAMGAFILSEAPFCPLMILHLALWGAAWRAAAPRQAVGLAFVAGVAAAAATLMRPSWLLFTPFALVIGLLCDKRRKQQALIGLVMFTSLSLWLSPWWVRNALLTGHFVPTTLQFGASLYDGLNPQADGSSNMSYQAPIEAEERAGRGQPRAAGESLDFEYRLNARLRQESVDWALAHPLRTLQLAGIKFVRIWNVWPNEAQFRSWPLRLAVALTYVPLLALGVCGAWKFSRWGWPYCLAWLPAVYITLLHMTFVSSIRYREPAMMALAVLAAGWLTGGRRPKGEPASEPNPTPAIV